VRNERGWRTIDEGWQSIQPPPEDPEALQDLIRRWKDVFRHYQWGDIGVLLTGRLDRRKVRWAWPDIPRIPGQLLDNIDRAARALAPQVLTAAKPVGGVPAADEDWLTASEAVERAEANGLSLTLPRLSKLAAAGEVRKRPPKRPGNHQLEVEWNSVAGRLTRKPARGERTNRRGRRGRKGGKRKAKKPPAHKTPGDTDKEIAQRIQEAHAQKCQREADEEKRHRPLG
jgi:hypothetical protein